MTLDPSTESAPGLAEPAQEALALAAAGDMMAREQTNAGVARATGVLALGNVASRVLGLVREIVISNLFGATAAVDAYNVAVVVPKGIFDLLIGGHVNGAIIPVLSEVVTLKGRDELWRLVSILLSMVTAVLAALVLLLELGAPLIVKVIGSGFDSYTQALATDLLRLTSPALIFMGLFAILSGTLYALHVFAWPAFATAVFNGAIVAYTLILAPNPQARIFVEGINTRWDFTRPETGITVVAAGWLVGSVAYVLLQLPGLRGAKLRLTLWWSHPAIRQIGKLYLPVMFSLVMDIFVIRLVSYKLASQTGEGSIAYMNYATTLIQFPQGLVATAISIAILPTLSRHAALIPGDDETQPNTLAFRDTLGLGLRLAITLILPATIGLFVLATPIVALIFQHGAFNAGSTEITAQALRLYLVGLPFAALDLLLIYAFYARQDTLTPALIGLLSLSLYMVIALLLLPRYGLYSLMIADSVKHIVHALVSAYLLNRRMGGWHGQRLLGTFGKTALAAGGMGVVTAVAYPVLREIMGDQGLIHELLLVGTVGGLSIVIYTVLALMVNLEEWRWLGKLVRRRLFD